MQNKRVFVVHGWKGKPSSNWFPWLKEWLKLCNVEVHVLEMPNADKPQLDEWLDTISSAVKRVDKKTFFVGHSLGCIAILRYLEKQKKRKCVGGVVFVAGFPERINFEETKPFFQEPLDYRKIKEVVGKKIIAIQSTNDEFVPFYHGETLRDKLGAKLVVVEGGGHLNKSSGYTELPEVRDELIDLMW
jgi:uncharacterized protein